MNLSWWPRARRWWNSISARIALAFSLLLIGGWLATLYVELFGVPGSAAGGWMAHVRDGDIARLTSEAENRAANLEQWVRMRRSEIELIAAGEPVHALFRAQSQDGRLGGGAREALQRAADWLAARRGAQMAFDALMLLSAPDGQVLAADGADLMGGAIPLLARLRGLLRRTDAEEIIDVVFDAEHLRPQLLIVRRVSVAGATAALGHVVALIDLEDEIKGNTEGQLIASLGRTTEINLYDQNGHFITTPRFANAKGEQLLPLTDMDYSRPAGLARNGGEGHILTTDYRGEAVLAAYRYIRITPEIGWGLVIKKDERESYQAIWRHMNAFIVLSAVGLFGVLAASLVVAQRLTQPLRNIVDAARAISGGDWQARAEIGGQTEVAELSVSFNDMAEQLAQWHRDLAEQVREKTAQILAEEGKLLSFSETTVDGMIIIDDAGCITFWNPAAVRIFGYAKEEALGQNVHRLLAPENMRHRADSAFSNYVLSGAGAIVNTLRELPALTKDGRQITIELVVSSLLQDGRRFAIGTVRDVTSRRRTENALRLVAEQLSLKAGDEYFRSLAGTLADLMHGDYVFVAEIDAQKPGLATTVGAFQLGELVANFSYALDGSPCAELLGGQPAVHRRDVQALFPRDATLTDMGVEAYAGVPLTDKDGRVIGLIAVLWRLRLPDSEDVGTFLRIFAARAGAELERLWAERALENHMEMLELRVTARTGELRRKNEELANALEVLSKAQRELVESEKLASLGSLVAGIAHELNTPIGNSVMVSTALTEKIRGFRGAVEAGGLKRSTLNGFLDDLDQAGRLIASNLHRSAELIQDFKQVAVDQTSSQRRHFDLRRTVDEVAALLHPRLKKTAHRLVIDVPQGIVLDSYPGPLGQVLTNLIQNSLTHAFGEGEAGTITISSETGGGAVRLMFTDDGCGMSEDVLAHVFEPFFTTKLGRGGSGLGMNITYNLVTGLLGGRIAIASAPGAGTSVRIELPVTAPLPQTEAAKA